MRRYTWGIRGNLCIKRHVRPHGFRDGMAGSLYTKKKNQARTMQCSVYIIPPLRTGLASSWRPHAASGMGTDTHRHVKATCIGERELACHPDRGSHPQGEQRCHVLKNTFENGVCPWDTNWRLCPPLDCASCKYHAKKRVGTW